LKLGWEEEMKHVACIRSVAILCLLAAAVSASADNGFLDFYSPQFLGGGGETVSNEAPMGTVFNPAVSANRQRLTFDLSYMALTQVTPSFAWGGNVVNLGVTWPTRVGVLSGIARFTNAGYEGTGLDWGTLGGLNVSFSKDLFDDLYVGAGLGFTYGGTAAATDWGLGLDLGLISLVGDLGFMKDFRWGLALRNLGKPYGTDTTANSLGFAPAFTPAVGASFALIKTDLLRLSAAPDLSFPSFQDVRFKLGMEFAVAEIFFIDAAYVFDLREVLPSVEPGKPIPFQFGVSLNLSNLGVKTAGTEVTEAKSSLSATPLQGGVWGFGLGATVPIGMRDRTPPAITIDTAGEKYISPNFDGVKDDLVLPLSITDNRYIKEYVFIITDAGGAVVRTIQNKEDRPENRDVKNILARLAYVKTGITIPESLRWDGKSDAGAVVPDGKYTYRVEARDDNGNLGKSPDGTVVVDNTPPVVKAAAAYLIFSPDGDGNKDALPLTQEGSVEDAWTGTIRTIAGETVRTYTWENGAPPAFEWDGKGADGAAAPDGVYSYGVTATDRAGNTGSAQVDNIIIDTKPTPVQLSIDLSFFSPNGDGVKDTVTFDPQVPVATGVEKWNLVVADEKGKARRTFSGTLAVPEAVPWDGRDDAGTVLSEGQYQGTLTVVYVNGRAPKATSAVVAIDVTPPRAATKADYDVFSPNGDGNKDSVSIFQDTSEEMFWTGAVRGPDGKDVKTKVWRGRADDKWLWDGTADDGSMLPDGAYVFTLSSTDRAGNTGSSAPITLRIDTEDTPVRVSADPPYFSPNGDGVKDKVRIIPALRVTSGVDSWSFKVKDASGAVVRTFSGRSKAPEEVAWDGIDDGGKHAQDGQYTAALEVVYVNGNKPKAESTPFFIDTRAPKIDVSADALLFSPTEDSKLTGVTITQTSSEEELWEGEIRSADGTKVRGWFWKGRAADFTWDGKDDNGNRMPDGYYTYAVKSQSKAGTATAKELRGIQIDTRPTPVYVTAASNGLSPNGDGFKDDITFTMIVSMKEGVKSWKLAMVEAAAGEQQATAGASPVPGTLKWDGRGRTGLKPAPDGLYTAVLTVEYHKGNVATAKSAPFRLAVSPPKVDLGLLGLPFSPDNDGVNDELTISLKVDDPIPIESWQIAILDPESHPFTGFGGKGAPSDKIIWNGTSDTGEVVQSAEDYPLTFTIRDELGNAATVKKVIPVDILVIKDGDKLKVRIASITFQANTADYVNVDIEKALKNGTTIKRLAEIFKKYSKYKIQIEGHANLINFDNAARAKTEQEQELIPLSKKRADAIRDALIKEGIEASRITTVGVGASAPIVDFSDLDNRWKNRRVEFVLVRQ
jgi:flagellar hook assembly protein FlgD/outer membrane protein OmpA-like peptidoglycan-associated protein